MHIEELFLLLVTFQAPHKYPLSSVSWRARQNLILRILRWVQKLLKEVFVSWLLLKPLVYLKTTSLDWSSITLRLSKSSYVPKLRVWCVISGAWALWTYLQALQQPCSALLDISLPYHEEGFSWTCLQLELLMLVNYSCWDELVMIVNDSHLKSILYSF